MKIIKEVRQVFTGNPVANANTSVTSWPEGNAIASGITDAEGLVTITAQGSPGSVKTSVVRGSTYDEYSDNIQPTSQFDLEYLRTRMSYLVNDGVIGGYGTSFAVSTGSGTIIVGSGGVVLDGIIALFPSNTTISVTNGDRALVAVLATDAVSLAEIAYSAIAAGTHVPLYRYTVSGGQVATSSVTPIHRLAGPRRGSKTIFGVGGASSGSTLSGSGEDAGISLTLDLESGVTYDIRARGSVVSAGYDGAVAVEIDGNLGTYRSRNGDVAGKVGASHNRAAVSGGSTKTVRLYDRRDTSATSSQWALQNAYTPSPALGLPAQVAVNSAGTIYVANPSNGTLRIFNSSFVEQPSISLPDISGVCVDSSDNVYTCQTGTVNKVKKYNSSHVLQWTSGINDTWNRIATDNTYVYITASSADLVIKLNAATSASAGSWGGSGTTDGKFTNPYGIAYNPVDGLIYIGDQAAADRVQVFTTAGVFQRKWTVNDSNTSSYDIAVDASGDIFLGSIQAFESNGTVRHTTNAGVAIDSFTTTGGAAAGIGVGSGDVLWIANDGTQQVEKWDEVVSNTPFSWNAGLLTAMAIPR